MTGQDDVISIWPEGIPCENALTEKINERGERNRSITEVHEPTLSVFIPKSGKKSKAGVIICPGGGYYLLAWDKEGIKIAEWFNSIGVTAFVLKYRLPHWETPACRSQVALMDAQRAIRTVRQKAIEYGLDAEKIGIMGFSAGGHLASTASTHFDLGDEAAQLPVDQVSCRPDFSILMYPVISLDTTIYHRGSRENLLGPSPNESVVTYFSNEKQVTKETPPAILIHANDDGGVVPENSIEYYLALRKHGVPAALHIYENGGHGFGLGEGMGAVSKWTNACEDWMKDRGYLE